MYALVIGRAYPEQSTGMIGIFELEQATAVYNNGNKVVYSFCDTRSLRHLHRYGYSSIKKNGISVYGYHLPIGGIPQKVFSRIKKMYAEKLLSRIIKDEGVPDIIHIHFPLIALNDGMWDLLKTLKKPIVVTEHWSKVQTKKIAPFQQKSLKRILNEADAFICVGDQLKKSVIELTDSGKEIRVIPNMVAPMFFYEEQEHKSDHFEFVAVGRLSEFKRFDLVIDAFTKAFVDNRNVHLTIVGGGLLFRKLKQQIHNLGISDRIKMVGFLTREETANIMRKSDAFVSGSILETFGVPFIEAMACGKPVIGIKNGPIDKFINATSYGVLFDQDSLDDLVLALKKVYEHRDLYDGKQISENANKIFSEAAVAKQLQEIFLNCIEGYR